MQYLLYQTYRLMFVFRKWRIRRFTPAGQAVLAGLVLSAIVGLDTKQTMVYQVFTLLLALVLIDMIFSLVFRMRFNASRILPRFGSAGHALHYSVVIHNDTGKTQHGLWLMEDLQETCPGYQEFLSAAEPSEKKRNRFDRALKYYRWLWLVSRKRPATFRAIQLPPLASHSETRVEFDIIPKRRGVIRLNALTIARPGPLGLFFALRTFPMSQTAVILPKRYDLPPISLAGSRRYQSGGVALASSVGDSEEFVSLRDYRPGDPLRKIHWKSWAKVGKPVVKDYQDEFFLRHALILDTFQDASYSDGLEEAVSIAASLSCQIQTQESLLDVMFVGTEAYCFTAGRGLAGTEKILEILAGVVPCRDKSFDYLTPVVAGRAARLSSCICILLAWDKERKKVVEHLRGMDIPTLVLVVADPENDRSDPDPGPMIDEPHNFHLLSLDDIQQGLMKL
jgi:uncharacterized protein (DUF58 family)